MLPEIDSFIRRIHYSSNDKGFQHIKRVWLRAAERYLDSYKWDEGKDVPVEAVINAIDNGKAVYTQHKREGWRYSAKVEKVNVNGSFFIKTADGEKEEDSLEKLPEY